MWSVPITKYRSSQQKLTLCESPSSDPAVVVANEVHSHGGEVDGNGFGVEIDWCADLEQGDIIRESSSISIVVLMLDGKNVGIGEKYKLCQIQF